jgi:hypothetical protein
MMKHEGMTKPEHQNASDAHDRFWENGETAVAREEPDNNRVYDLEERTARFGEEVIDFAKTIPQDAVTNRIITQLVGAPRALERITSKLTMPYRRKNFYFASAHAEKEARETKHFLRMSARAVPELKLQARRLWMEAKELNLIFSKIWRSGK